MHAMNCWDLLSINIKSRTLKDRRVLQLQLDAIDPTNALIPNSYSGTEDAVREFSSKYDIDIIDNMQIGNVDKYVVNGIVLRPHFKGILESLAITDFDPLSKTVQGALGVQANLFITQQEGIKIARDIKNFMRTGIERIVEKGDNTNIRPAECRTSI